MKVFAQWIVLPACYDRILTEHHSTAGVFAFVRLVKSTP
jgi:hypothetical protein